MGNSCCTKSSHKSKKGKIDFGLEDRFEYPEDVLLILFLKSHEIDLWYETPNNNFHDDYTGFGRILYDDLSLYYIGEFSKGKIDGTATMYDRNGNEKYEGSINDGVRDGFGTQYHENGQVMYKGRWFQDLITSISYSGSYESIKVYHDNGQVKYDGFIVNGLYENTSTLYHPNGSLEYTGDFIKGEMNQQHAKIYYPNGQLKFTGNLVMGEPSGECFYYHDNGAVKVCGNFVNGGYNEDGVINHPNGKTHMIGNFIKGKLEGEAEEYYDTGTLKYKGNFVNGGYDNSDATIYHPDGSLCYTGTIEAGSKEGEGFQYWPNGQLRYAGEFEKDKPTGIVSDLHVPHLFFHNGKSEYIGDLIHGVPNGRGEEYWINGKIKIDGYFKKGVIDGEVLIYYSDGTKYYEGETLCGYKHGFGIEFTSKGNKKYIGIFKLDQRHGRGILYFKSGKVKYEGFWKDGKIFGLGKEFHSNGQIRYSGMFKNGGPHGDVCIILDENGKVQFTGRMKDGVDATKNSGIIPTDKMGLEGSGDENILKKVTLDDKEFEKSEDELPDCVSVKGMVRSQQKKKNTVNIGNVYFQDEDEGDQHYKTPVSFSKFNDKSINDSVDQMPIYVIKETDNGIINKGNSKIEKKNTLGASQQSFMRMAEYMITDNAKHRMLDPCTSFQDDKLYSHPNMSLDHKEIDLEKKKRSLFYSNRRDGSSKSILADTLLKNKNIQDAGGQTNYNRMSDDKKMGLVNDLSLRHTNQPVHIGGMSDYDTPQIAMNNRIDNYGDSSKVRQNAEKDNNHEPKGNQGNLKRRVSFLADVKDSKKLEG